MFLQDKTEGMTWETPFKERPQKHSKTVFLVEITEYFKFWKGSPKLFLNLLCNIRKKMSSFIFVSYFWISSLESYLTTKKKKYLSDILNFGNVIRNFSVSKMIVKMI
jgi:hypothetical protein